MMSSARTSRGVLSRTAVGRSTARAMPPTSGSTPKHAPLVDGATRVTRPPRRIELAAPRSRDDNAEGRGGVWRETARRPTAATRKPIADRARRAPQKELRHARDVPKALLSKISVKTTATLAASTRPHLVARRPSLAEDAKPREHENSDCHRDAHHHERGEQAPLDRDLAAHEKPESDDLGAGQHLSRSTSPAGIKPMRQETMARSKSRRRPVVQRFERDRAQRAAPRRQDDLRAIPRRRFRA